jgi:hypothetical protein
MFSELPIKSQNVALSCVYRYFIATSVCLSTNVFLIFFFLKHFWKQACLLFTHREIASGGNSPAVCKIAAHVPKK